MKAVLMSVRPQHCENICTVIGYDKDGKPIYKKRIEVRKTKPKLEVPFKVYIYCTKPRKWWAYTTHLYTSDEYLWLSNGKVEMNDGFRYWAEGGEYQSLNGKVIGEFVCDGIISHCEMANADIAEQQGCIKREKLLEYSNGKELFGWHISNLKIYDKPKELKEFQGICKHKHDCFACGNWKVEYCELELGLTRPPQSWCYVEEVRV